MKQKILIIGKNSFLAKGFISECANNEIDYFACSHIDIPEVLDGYRTIINFSIDPDFYRKEYNEKLDQDLLIAKKIKHKNINQVLISSRTVYGILEKLDLLDETSKLDNNKSTYASNKIKSEQNCMRLLGKNRLTIVRASNIFGIEIGRHTFMGVAQRRLLERSEILLDISMQTVRDFLPVVFFSKLLLELVCRNAKGIYNVGSNQGTSLKEICESIIAGYGSGKIVEKSNVKVSDQFILDTTKLKKLTSLRISKKDVLEYCYLVGEQLKKQDLKKYE